MKDDAARRGAREGSEYVDDLVWPTLKVVGVVERRTEMLTPTEP